MDDTCTCTGKTRLCSSSHGNRWNAYIPDNGNCLAISALSLPFLFLHHLGYQFVLGRKAIASIMPDADWIVTGENVPFLDVCHVGSTVVSPCSHLYLGNAELVSLVVAHRPYTITRIESCFYSHITLPVRIRPSCSVLSAVPISALLRLSVVPFRP